MRWTTKSIAVLLAFLDAGLGGRLYGFEIMQAASIFSGTLYPILDRFEQAGWITGEWEEPAPEGRPRRKYYYLTELGLAQANAARTRGQASRSPSRPRSRPATA